MKFPMSSKKCFFFQEQGKALISCVQEKYLLFSNLKSVIISSQLIVFTDLHSLYPYLLIYTKYTWKRIYFINMDLLNHKYWDIIVGVTLKEIDKNLLHFERFLDKKLGNLLSKTL